MVEVYGPVRWPQQQLQTLTSWDRPRTNSVTLFHSSDRLSTGEASFALTAGRVSAWTTQELCFDGTEILFSGAPPDQN